MKLELESTSEFLIVNGAAARLWQGTTARGVPVVAVIISVAIPAETSAADAAAFERELVEHAAPSRLVLEVVEDQAG